MHLTTDTTPAIDPTRIAVDRVDILDVPCPTCDVVRGEDCDDGQPHVTRVEDADDATRRRTAAAGSLMTATAPVNAMAA